MKTRITGFLGPFGARGSVLIDGQTITAVRAGRAEAAPARPRAPAGTVTEIDVGDAIVAPGFVDLQVNGVADVDFGAADARALARALDALTDHGTTACLPTLVTAPLRRYESRLQRLNEARTMGGARGRCAVLGCHLEGPFLGGAPGAHPHELVRDVDLHWLEQLLARHGDIVAMVTLAPEADPGLAGTRMLVDGGVVVAIGHSACSSAEAAEAADAGATVVAHLYNSMSGVHHRSPGVAAAALTDDRLTPTLIPDLVHVHPVAIRLAIAAKPRLAVVTDAVAPGASAAGGPHLVTRDGAAYLDDGTLAGSLLTMDGALRNLVTLGVPLAAALRMTSTIPCDIVGAHDRGRLDVGARADLVVLERESLAVQQVWIAGERVR